MAIFYYNGIAAQGSGDGSTSLNASNDSAAAIATLGGGVEVTDGPIHNNSADVIDKFNTKKECYAQIDHSDWMLQAK